MSLADKALSELYCKKQEVQAEVPPIFTPNYLLGDFVLSILISLNSVGLEILVPKGDIDSVADTTRALETMSSSCH